MTDDLIAHALRHGTLAAPPGAGDEAPIVWTPPLRATGDIMPTPDPEGMRHVIAAEKSVPHSIAGLLRAICSQTYAAIEANDFGPIKALADAISRDPKAWSDAIMANTPTAMETAGFAHSPSYVGSATPPPPVTDQHPPISSEAPPDKSRDGQRTKKSD